MSISLPLKLWEKFRPGQPVPKELGPNRDYNIDLVPKFMMANGKLVKVLLHTDVVKYLEFKAVDGSYVGHDRGESVSVHGVWFI